MLVSSLMTDNANFIVLNCRLQAQQVNVMESAIGPFCALCSLRFLSASHILLFS